MLNHVLHVVLVCYTIQFIYCHYRSRTAPTQATYIRWLEEKILALYFIVLLLLLPVFVQRMQELWQVVSFYF